MLISGKTTYFIADVPEILQETSKRSEAAKRSGRGERPSHLESMSASSFFSPGIWLHSRLIPVMELHMESSRTKRLSG